MDPLTILAVVDAGITAYERAMRLLNEAHAAGLITAEQQAQRLAHVTDSRALAGLPPRPTEGS